MFVSSILWSILCLSIVRSNHALSFFVRPVELPPRCSLYSPFLFLTQFHSLILILPSFRVKQKYKVTLLISSLPSPFPPLSLPFHRFSLIQPTALDGMPYSSPPPPPSPPLLPPPPVSLHLTVILPPLFLRPDPVILLPVHQPILILPFFHYPPPTLQFASTPPVRPLQKIQRFLYLLHVLLRPSQRERHQYRVHLHIPVPRLRRHVIPHRKYIQPCPNHAPLILALVTLPIHTFPFFSFLFLPLIHTLFICQYFS